MVPRRTRSQDRMATAAEEAELLAAAHEQAMEEEAISARLPREVLNIQRRLEQQQSSVDLLQGNISKLTDMVTQISLAVVRNPDSPEQDSMVTNQNSSAFSTPAPNPTQLSPIPEGSTPVSTPMSQVRHPQSTPQQQQPIYFRNLALTRLPHPEFPPQTLPPTPTNYTISPIPSTTSLNTQNSAPFSALQGCETDQGLQGSTHHFAPEPSPVLDLDKSNGWQPKFQQGATSDSPALHVFGEMPTPHSLHGMHAISPGYWNCSYCHHTPIPSSCVQAGTTNLSEQNLEMPQSYDFNSLKRRSVLLADGSEHSFYALPEDYPLERATRDPVYDADEDETDCSSTEFVEVFVGIPEQQQKYEDQLEGEQLLKCLSKAPETEQTSKYLRNPSENKTHSSRSPMSAIATDLMQFQAFERQPVFDVYDDDTEGCSSKSVPVDVFAGTLGQQTHEESEELAKIFHKTPENAFSEQLLRDFSKAPETEQTSAHVLDFALELQQQSDEKACNYLVLKASGSVVTSSNQLSIDHSMRELRQLWDPGASACLATRLNNDNNNNDTIGVFKEAMLDIPPTKPPERYGSADYSQVNVQLRAPPLNVLVIHEKRNEWDLGAAESPVLFTAAAGATKLHSTDVYKYEFTCSFETKNLLISLVNLKKMILWPSWQLQLSTPVKLFVQLLCANAAVQVPKQTHHLECVVMDDMWQNVSVFRDGQLAYISQGTSIRSSEWVSNMVSVLSCRLPSFEMAKLQWDLGIFQRGTIMSSLFDLQGIPLWLISFQVP